MSRLAAIAATTMLAAATTAAAQTEAPAALRPGHLVIAVGGGWLGSDALGAVRAETRQATAGTTTPPPFTLFDTESELGAGIGVDGALTMAITRGWAVELRGNMRTPTLTTTITGDAEAPGTVTATEEVAEYVFDASALYHPGWGAIGTRTRIYMLGGAGYLRQLHDDDALVESGATAHLGAGARLWLAGGHGQGIEAGITGDVRWTFRRDGITFDDGTRSLPAFTVRTFVGF
jgi:hypothetical protein